MPWVMHTGSTLVPGLDHQLSISRASIDRGRNELAFPPVAGELRCYRGFSCCRATGEKAGLAGTRYRLGFPSDDKIMPDGRRTIGPINRLSDRPAQGGEAGRLIHLATQCSACVAISLLGIRTRIKPLFQTLFDSLGKCVYMHRRWIARLHLPNCVAALYRLTA